MPKIAQIGQNLNFFKKKSCDTSKFGEKQRKFVFTNENCPNAILLA